MGKNNGTELRLLGYAWKVYETPDPDSVDQRISVSEGAPCDEITLDDLVDSAVKLYMIKQDLARLAKPA